MKTCQTYQCPWSNQAFTRATTKSVTVWKGGRGISGPWTMREWEPVGLPVLPSPGTGGEPKRAAPQPRSLAGGCLLCSWGHRAWPRWTSWTCSRGEQDPLSLLYQKKDAQESSLIITHSKRSLKLFQSSYVSMCVRLFFAALRKHRGEWMRNTGFYRAVNKGDKPLLF